MSNRDYDAGVSWAEVWSLWADLERQFNCRVVVRLWNPQRLASGLVMAPRVAVTAEWLPEGSQKPLTRFCAVGGTQGARTAAAATQRAMCEVYWALEEREGDAAQQAAF